MEVVICENDQKLCNYFGQIINKEFSRQSFPIQLHLYYTPSKLLNELPGITSQIFFLDIDMPLIDGITLAKKIREMNQEQEILIIYISCKEERVFESFSTKPLRFIRKDHFTDEIREAVQAILDNLSVERPVFQVEQNGKLIAIKIHHILYVESHGHTQYIHTQKKVYEIYSKLSCIQEQLRPYGFLLIHKSILVNWRAIYSINKNSILIENGDTLPVSKHRLADVKKQYQALLAENLNFFA